MNIDFDKLKYMAFIPCDEEVNDEIIQYISETFGDNIDWPYHYMGNYVGGSSPIPYSYKKGYYFYKRLKTDQRYRLHYKYEDEFIKCGFHIHLLYTLDSFIYIMKCSQSEVFDIFDDF